MNLKNMKKALLASTLGTAMLLGVSIVANAQVYGTYRDYRDYQKQQQKIAREQARQQRRAVERYYRSSNGTYRDQYGNTIVVGQNGYYQDQMGNLYNRNGTVVYSSGNRVVTYPSNSYYNNNRYSNTNGYYNNGYTYGTTGSYRLYNNGSYYTTDYRGMALLRQAVNTGYQQGYQQGQMDRRYGRNTNYYNNNLYLSGNYGYQSYVDSSQYQYYFQQGFQRGYQDGYSSTMRYGYRTGNTFGILGSILDTIVNVAQ